jgi:hypothetical protein
MIHLKLELVINLKTMRTLGLTVPESRKHMLALSFSGFDPGTDISRWGLEVLAPERYRVETSRHA